MSVSLQKGQKVSLTKENAGLSKVIVGLGWDQAKKSGGFFSQKALHIDCDSSAIMLVNGKFSNKNDVVYFGNLTHPSQTVLHLGDNLTGAGDQDDEQIVVELSKVPASYDKIVIAVNIYQAVQRKQHFGLIQNAFIRIIDGKTNVEMFKYNLTGDYSNTTAMIFGEIYRNNGEWKFNPVGEGTNDPGLAEVVKRYS